MPKIIQDLENRLVEEARRQVETNGYGAVTIRSVALACGVGVGTVYNYFAAKDDLLAAYMLRDWKDCVSVITSVSESAEKPETIVRCMYDQLLSFSARHQNVFRDEAAAAEFAGAFGRYHGLLRSQLAAPLQKFCGSTFAAEFISESLLTWTMAGKEFEEIWKMIEKLLSD